MGLRARFDLKVPLPSTVSIVGSGTRRTVIEDGRTVERYPVSYDYGDRAADDIKFALRYEPIDLGILHGACLHIDPKELEDWYRREPTGAFSRRAWFFYEFLTGRTLDLPDATAVGRTPALDPSVHVVGPSQPSWRHRVDNNLLGGAALCPVVRLTPRLKAAMASRIGDEARSLIAECDPDILARAISYIYTKETKSSYSIEGEVVGATKADRFVSVLRSVKSFRTSAKEDYIKLQNVIVDPRYAAVDWRSFQNYIGQTVGGHREIVHFVCPRPEDVPFLMDGMLSMAGRLMTSEGGALVDPVVRAALISFAFVFIHPFEDGNGRIHRFLIHHALADGGLTPPGVLFPVSAVMVRDRGAYDAALETFSKSIMPHITWGWRPEAEGEITVTNDTRDLYRFFDATPLAEYLYDCVIETVRRDLREEITFVEVFDRAVTGIMDRIDMPDRRAARFAQFCIQNNGRLAARKRDSFSELTDAEVTELEAIVATAMARDPSN